jgi:GTP-binding protein EngB required for normal cell division
MNALLGGDHLPTGIVPLTSVITTVRYGSQKQVVLNFDDSGMRRKVPISQLAEYVTQQSNPGNVKHVAYAEIELPVEILRRGFFFVDSPGLGSSIPENTRTTEQFMPEADAFILVTSYESPLSEEEDRILHRIRLTNKKLFIALNKQDTVTAEERQQALNFVEERLERFSFLETPHIFSISAREALEAKESGSEDHLTTSGLPALENELLRFLTEERAQSFLTNMYERVRTFLTSRLRSESEPSRKGAYNLLIERLLDLRRSSGETEQKTERASAADGESIVTTSRLELERHVGCWICGSVLDAILQFLRQYQYDLTINPQTQHEHAERGGFCSLHTWQYENMSSPYGVCTAYAELAHRISGEITRLAEESTRTIVSLESPRTLVATVDTCRVCEVRIEAEKKAVQVAVDAALDADGGIDKRMRACCLPHLVLVARALGPGRPVQSLLTLHAKLMERVAEDLQRYALRHDALRRYLTSEEERQASQLALLLLGGHRSVGAPWAVESIVF